MHPPYWQQAVAHLSQDPKMASLMQSFPDLTLSSRGNDFVTLLRSIVGQQISVSAADSIWGRLEQNINPLQPKTVLKTPIAELKTLGLSTQKANYLHCISRHFSDHNINPKYWQNRPYSDIKQELITIKGIGEWTAEMFGIFYLLEADIFPIKDLGLVRAIHRLYSPKTTLTTDQIIQLSQHWKPYRTVATWYLWRSIDAEVVQY